MFLIFNELLSNDQAHRTQIISRTQPTRLVRSGAATCYAAITTVKGGISSVTKLPTTYTSTSVHQPSVGDASLNVCSQ